MEPQRGSTLDGQDLIKNNKKEKNGRKQSGKAKIEVIAELTVAAFGGFFHRLVADERKQKEKLPKMTFIKLAGLSILLALSFQSSHTLGETFLPAENGKDGGVKTPEKRTNNFRVPMETTFDPNFWPARGRRSRRDPERDPQQENCVTSLDKGGIQCQQTPKIYEGLPVGRRTLPDFDLFPPVEVEEELSTVEKPEGSCLDVGKTRPGRNWGVRANLLTKGFDELRRKKQRHSGLPQLVLYGNGVYWEPENLYGEKKKKQDVFWVARGKKNFNFPEK